MVHLSPDFGSFGQMFSYQKINNKKKIPLHSAFMFKNSLKMPHLVKHIPLPSSSCQTLKPFSAPHTHFSALSKILLWATDQKSSLNQHLKGKTKLGFIIHIKYSLELILIFTEISEKGKSSTQRKTTNAALSVWGCGWQMDIIFTNL